MRCDGAVGCKIEPQRAPRLIVPHVVKPGLLPLRPRRMFTDLHYCEMHRIDIDAAKLAQDLLSPQVKRDFERAAMLKWPLGYKCDFDRAYVEWVLVTTPEYRAFLAALGHAGVMGAARLSTDEQQAARTHLGVKKIASL